MRVSAAGTKSFVLLYRLKGRAKRMTFGRYPVLSLLDACEMAQDLLKKLTKGENPQAEKKAQRAYPRFDDVLAEFLRLYCGRQ